MPPSKSKRIIRVTLAVFALAGILGVLGLVERTSKTPDSGIDAKLAADVFSPSGDSGSAFSGDLGSFVGSQFGAGALEGVPAGEQAALSSLFAAGQTLGTDPAKSLANLNSVDPNASATKALSRAIAGTVRDTFNAAMRLCRAGPICAKIRQVFNRIIGRFLGEGGGGGGGPS